MAEAKLQELFAAAPTPSFLAHASKNDSPSGLLGFLGPKLGFVSREAGRSPHHTRTILSTFVLAWVIGCLFFYFRSVYRSYNSPLAKIPGPWYAHWTTMHLRWGFAQGTVWKYVEESHRKYGDVIRLGPRQIWVAEKEGLKDILVSTDLPKVSMYAEISRDRNSPGLFGEIRNVPHRNLKKFLGPAFTVSSVDTLDSFFKGCVGTLLENYYTQIDPKKNETTEFKTDLMRDLHCLALDIMGESSFGKGFGQIDKIFDPSKVVTARDREWSKIPDAIFDGQVNRYRFVFIKRTLRKLGWDIQFDWPRHMTRAISSLIDDRQAAQKEDPGSRREKPDVLQHMLDEGERPDTGTRMNNQEIIDQMSEILLAGSETTAGTIGCLFLEISRNPEVRKKLLDSLPVFTPEDPIIDSKAVREDRRFEYLEACIKENLRMHPIASEMGRRSLEKEYEVGGYEIPQFTVVSASYRQLHHDARHWPEPERFWPERWLEGEAREGAPEPDMESYYPFSGGKHACIGKNFAYAEMRTVSANLFTRFDVQEDGYQEIDFRQYITMQFHDGKWKAKLTPRWEVEA